MLPIERERRILDALSKHGSVVVRDLAENLGVTEVTIRRDLRHLDGRGLLRRAHGGAVPVVGPVATAAVDETIPPVADALILAPVQHKAAHALRERAQRNRIPLLAESASQDGAVYVGPDNRESARKLGVWTARRCRDDGSTPVVLDVTHRGLSNTRSRSQGFLEGLQAESGTPCEVISIDCRGHFVQAYQASLDAFRAHVGINVVFGVNDDAVLGALQAYRDLGRPASALLAVNVGGEGDTILNELSKDGPLQACLALFPQVVGRTAIDTVVRLWCGVEIPDAVSTPTVVLTPATIQDYYRLTDQVWFPLAAKPMAAEPASDERRLDSVRGRLVSFVIQFRTHEWYQNLAQAMRDRADELGLRFEVIDVKDDFAAEIHELRRLIGKLAASYVSDGDTIILDTGTTTKSMARFLHGKRDLTVITNSIDVLRELRDDAGVDVMLTGGRFQRASGALVGPVASLLMNQMRADKAFLVAGGVSIDFGVSCKTVEEAEVRRAMIAASRETVVLADHTVMGSEAKVHVAAMAAVHTLVTDAGVSSDQSLELARLGIRLMVAGRVAPVGGTAAAKGRVVAEARMGGWPDR